MSRSKNVDDRKKNLTFLWNLKLKENKSQISLSPIYLRKNNIILGELQKTSGRMLNVGFGYGLIEDQIVNKKLELELYGVDISDYAVSEIVKKKIGKYKSGNATKLTFKNNFFDVGMALDVLEHLDDYSLDLSLKELYRVITTGGRIIVSVPTSEHDNDYQSNMHLQKFNKNMIISVLNKYGFDFIRSYELSAFKSMFLFKSFINNYVFKFRDPNLIIIIASKR